MFDIDPKKQETKFRFFQDLFNPDTSSCEDILPISHISNGIVYLKDDSKLVYLTLPGKNLSLLSDTDKENYAMGIAKIFSGLTVETSGIFYIPEKTDSNENLNRCRNRIKELDASLYDFRGSENQKKSLYKQLEILKHIHDDLEKQSVGNSKGVGITVQGKTYLAMKFLYAREREIFNTLFTVKKRIIDTTGKEATWLENTEDILNLIDSWINCHVPRPRTYTPKIIMPAF